MPSIEHPPASHAAGRPLPRLNASDGIAIAGIGGPVVFLVLRGGGVDVEEYCAASAIALAAAAFAALLAGFRSRAYRVPWFVVAILSLPFVQLIPLASFPDILVSNEIRELRLAVARLGVEPPSTISLYPLATLRSGIVAAGCCGIFVLASGLRKRLPAAWPLALSPLGAAGIWQAVEQLRQYLHSQSRQPGALLFSHGSFINRDHYAVLLEACLGVAIGLALCGSIRARRRGWLTPAGALCLAGTALAALSLSGIVLSASRAGILIGALFTAAGLFVAVLDGSRGKLVRRAPAALALAVAALIALGAAIPHETLQRFETLWNDRGEAVRLAIWADSWRTVHDYPWAGSGLGAFASAFRRSWLYVPEGLVDHAHSDYLEFLVELGFPAAIFLAILIAAGTWASFRSVLRMPSSGDRWLPGGCLLGAATILLHAAVDFPLRIPALAFVFATLAGFASGGGNGTAKTGESRAKRAHSASSIGLFSALALLALWTGFGDTERYDAELLFERAEAESIGGDHESAEQLYRAALSANPFAAGLWLKRGALARQDGDAAASASYHALARSLEPFTMRAEWPLVQHQLTSGRYTEASRTLAVMADAMPQMRRGIYASALGAGISPEFAARTIVPAQPHAADVFLRFLVERYAWDGLVPALRAFDQRTDYSPSDDLLQFMLDGLFAAEQTATMIELTETLADDSAATVAFPWLARDMQRVRVRIDRHPPADEISIDFKAPGNVAYGHVYRYFAVDALKRHILEAEVRTELLHSAEPVRIAVRTPSRTLAVSQGLRGSRPWQTLRVALTPGTADRVVRVEITRPRGPRAVDAVTGRLFLRNVRLIAAGHPAT